MRSNSTDPTEKLLANCYIRIRKIRIQIKHVTNAPQRWKCHANKDYSSSLYYRNIYQIPLKVEDKDFLNMESSEYTLGDSLLSQSESIVMLISNGYYVEISV